MNEKQCYNINKIIKYLILYQYMCSRLFYSTIYYLVVVVVVVQDITFNNVKPVNYYLSTSLPMW